jgi:asparagine synthase (glutamine-hydrolysing)
MQLAPDDASTAIANTNLVFDDRTRSRLAPALEGLGPDRVLSPERLRQSRFTGRSSIAERLMAVDFTTYMVDDILVKTDRASMLASLELRAPFLDHRIVEFAFGRLPLEEKIDGNKRKVVCRRLAERLLPKELDVGRKQGFTLPLDDWFRGPWGTYAESVLLDGSASPFDRRQLERVLTLQRRGCRNAHRLFALTLFELWRHTYGVPSPT